MHSIPSLRAVSLKQYLHRGNFIIIAGATLAITGLTFGGIRFPWDSAQVLAPLIIGLVLMAFFFFYESKFAEYPCIPWEVVGNLSSLSGYASSVSTA